MPPVTNEKKPEANKTTAPKIALLPAENISESALAIKYAIR